MAKWIIDPDHSVAAFRVRHMTVAFVRGQFNGLHGSLTFDRNHLPAFALEFTIEAAGIHTGIAKRDAHLKSADFFDVAKYPELLFKSRDFTPDNSGGRLTGDLTMHGVKKPVTLELTISGPVKSPEDLGGETVVGITATAVLNREDFGLRWNVPLGEDAMMIGNEIAISLDIEADRE